MSQARTLADNVVDMLFSLVPYPMPQNIWLSLHNETGEIRGGNYSRVNVTGKFALSRNGATSNMAQIEFPVPSIGWGTISQVGLCDAETEGNILMLADIETPFQAPAKTNVFFSIGVINFGITI